MTAEIITTQKEALSPAQLLSKESAIEHFLAEYDAEESSLLLYNRALRQFFTWVENTGRVLNTLTRSDIIEYKRELLETKSPLTAASYLNVVKVFYSWLHDTNGLITNIAAGVDLPKRAHKFERKPLTESKAGELLDEVDKTASARDRAIIYLLLNCGLRTIEIVRANIKDLQSIGGDCVLYVQGKGQLSKNNFVPLSANTASALTLYLAERPNAEANEPLFTCTGNRNKNGRLTTRTISNIARRHLDAIGLQHNSGERNSSYTAHSLRHTYGCTMLKATEDYHITQLLLRHASPATTQQYVYHIDELRRLKAAKEHNIDNLYRV